MEPFDQNEFENQPVQPEQPVPQPEPAPQPEPTTYHQAGAGRKESPYADSPYVTQAREEYQYQPQTQPPAKPPKAPKSGRGRRCLAALLILVLVAGSCTITGFAVSSHLSWESANMAADLNQRIDDLEAQLNSSKAGSGNILQRPPVADGTLLSPNELYARNVASVVAVTSTVQSNTPYGTTEGTSSGSGFILSSDGYIVTNCHVVEGASRVEITTNDGTVYPTEVVGTNRDNDIAVLKADATDLPAAVIGRSSDLSIGDMVVAIGNPLGELTSTQTVGYVSGINREITSDSSIINMIQTDAAINPGNSGGPLFNMKGEVVGITTAKYSGTTGSGASIEGIGFAIPIDDVSGIIEDLIQYGYVTGAYLGVTVQNTDPEATAKYGLPSGAYVVTVVDGGSADRAGVQPKDIIIDLGGTKIAKLTDLTRALRQFKAGDTTTITVVRGGAEVTMDITLDEKPAVMPGETPTEQLPMPDEGNYDEWYDYFRRFFGE